MKKIPNIIRLKKSDFQLIKKLNASRTQSCSASELKVSFDKHVKDGLRYNQNSGITRDNSGGLAWYRKGEAEKYNSRDEAIKWELMKNIANSCSRIRRGYKP